MADASDGNTSSYDVAVVGGGPSGATLATLLRKYNPDIRVVVLERARFPREHVGESQLPAVCAILNEMEVWDKVELAGFPIKLGASLTWGSDDESWDFDFYPPEEFRDEARPAKYEGQRRHTSFQVDRAIYDQILLDHAAECGAEVRQETGVREVLIQGDRVVGLKLDNGEVVCATHYVDASGAVGLFRRALGIAVDAPKELRNIAMWDYWENIEWAVKIGVGGTRVQVRSVPYGWIWFIPLSPTRASIGLVCPADYYTQTGLRPAELYHKAIAGHEQIAHLTRNGHSENNVRTVKDWSFVTERLAGENWYICGEAAGFADPILAAGLTLHQGSARDLAYTILEIERGELDADWLKHAYSTKTERNVRQYIQFAQFWYASNGCFTDLQSHCQSIAKEAGLTLSPGEAWRWLAQGGFANQTVGSAQFGSFDFASAKRLVEKFYNSDKPYKYEQFNVFKLNLIGAKRAVVPDYREGRVYRVECYTREHKVLPIAGDYDNVMRVLKVSSDGQTIFTTLRRSLAASRPSEVIDQEFSDHVHALEAMLVDGWVKGKFDKRKPRSPSPIEGGRAIRSTTEGLKAMEKRGQ